MEKQHDAHVRRTKLYEGRSHQWIAAHEAIERQRGLIPPLPPPEVLPANVIPIDPRIEVERLRRLVVDARILRHVVKTAKSRGLLDEFRRAYRLARHGRMVAGAVCVAAFAVFGPTMTGVRFLRDDR